MVNYQAYGNTPLSELFGKENAEKLLKGMNLCKSIAVKLGAEYNPPYIWNKNMPDSWCKIIATAVIDKVDADINWKPDEAFIDKLRKELRDV